MSLIRMAYALIFVTCLSFGGTAQAQDLTRFTQLSGQAPLAVDHSVWDAFLTRYLVMGSDGISRVRYQAAQANKAELDAYIAYLSSLRPSMMPPKQAMAYWINFYNALTVKVVLDNMPISSIRQIDGFLGFGGPWKRQRVTVEGQQLSLDHMEHGILRPGFRDPRVHYGVNCASYSCPNLAARAYTAANLDGLLDQGARAYVNHPRGAQVRGGRLHVSSIYTWFKEDFGSTDAGVIAHLRRYADPALAAQLNGITRIASDNYDWSLNDAP